MMPGIKDLRVGPSFGDNFNNRTEEAMGSALGMDRVSGRRV